MDKNHSERPRHARAKNSTPQAKVVRPREPKERPTALTEAIVFQKYFGWLR